MSLFQKVRKKRLLASLSMLIFGFVKTGKSTLLAQFKIKERSPLFIATEDGHHELDVFAHRIYDWNGFIQFIAVVEKNKEQVVKEHSCFVIDLLSDLDQWCQEYVATSLGIKDLADAEWGKGYNEHKKEFQKQVNRLFAILPVSFIAHAKEKKIHIEGEPVELQAPNIPNRTLEYVNGKVDLVGFIIPSSKTNGHPYITFQPSQLAMAGSRIPALAKPFELNPTDMEASYKAIEETLKAVE